jgi:hypothetical protein
MLFGRRGERSIPSPRPEVVSRSTPSRLIPIPTTGPRWHDAVVHLEDVLSAWALPVQLARRWMHPAREAFQHDAPLDLFVQLDPVDGLICIELWDEQGAKVYAADAYLGTPETVAVTLDRRVRTS